MSVKCFIFHSRNFWLLPPVDPNLILHLCDVKLGKCEMVLKMGTRLHLSFQEFVSSENLFYFWSLQRLYLKYKCSQVLVSSGAVKPGDTDFDPEPLQGVAPLTSASRSRTAFCGTSPGFWLAPENTRNALGSVSSAPGSDWSEICCQAKSSCRHWACSAKSSLMNAWDERMSWEGNTLWSKTCQIIIKLSSLVH